MSPTKANLLNSVTLIVMGYGVTWMLLLQLSLIPVIFDSILGCVFMVKPELNKVVLILLDS